MNLAFVLIGLCMLGVGAYFMFKFIKQNGFMDVITIGFVLLSIYGLFKLIKYTGEGSHV